MAAATAGGRISAGAGANIIGQHAADRNQEATCYVGNIDPQADEELLWELFIQAGPVLNVYMPKDRVTSQHQGYGFVEYRSEIDAEYAIRILNMIKLYGKPLRVSKATQDKSEADIGANLFIGNLDPDVDEKLIYDTFSAFGVVKGQPKIMRDPETGTSKGFGFVAFEDFDASDAAIESMNGQWLMNRQITCQYAYKRDSPGERHGTHAERLLAAQRKAQQGNSLQPHTLFASGPKQAPQAVGGQPPLQQQQRMPGMGMTGFPTGGMPWGAMPPPPPMYGVPPPPPMHYGGLLPPPPGVWSGAGGMVPPPPPTISGMNVGMPPPPPPPT